MKENYEPSDNKWVPYQDIDFSGDYNWINIDTRDFHAIIVNSIDCDLVMPPNYRNNKEKYFHTPEELKNLIDRYYTESGGKGEWRMFALAGATEVSGWDMKYIAVVRHKLGLLVCKRPRCGKLYPIKKSTLKLPVRQEHLNHIDQY